MNTLRLKFIHVPNKGNTKSLTNTTKFLHTPPKASATETRGSPQGNLDHLGTKQNA